jgi:iron complex outermembrane receptor protein
VKRYIYEPLLTVLCGLILAPAAFSQSNPPSPAGPAPASTPQIEEVVVTVQRRQETLQEVPTSAEVVSGETIAQKNLGSLVDLAETVPSVHISNDGAGGQLFIRGVGSGSNETFDQSVATFVDDIYHGSAHETAASFLDVERVEVLKGPQSTFFGNNAIAGALNIVTAKPTLDGFSGSARALYGDYGQYTAEAAVNVPVSDQFAFRVAANVNGLSGWQENPYVGENQPNQSNQAGRISALWQPSDTFDAILKVESTKNVDRTGSVIGDCPPAAPFVAAGFCATALGLGLPTGGLHSDINTSGPGQGIWLNTFDTVLTANYHRWNHTFTSVTGYSSYDSTQNLNASATPQDELGFQLGEKYHQFSQEFRVTSPAGQPVEYLGGIYFQTDHTDGDPGALTYFFLTPTIQSIPSFAALTPYLPLAESPSFVQSEQVYSIFGSLTWHITDALRLNAGLRETWDRKDASLSAFYGTGTQQFGSIVPFPANLQSVLGPLAGSLLGAVNDSSDTQTYKALMPSAGLQYDLTANSMAYFTYANGFKAGVPVTAFAGIVSPPLLPEHVNSYEFGVKNELFGRRVLLNFDVFRSNYRDLQVSSTQFTPTGAALSVITNAASSLSEGAEFEGKWIVTENFRLDSSVTYLDSRYVRYPNVTPTYIQSFCNSNPAASGCAALFPNGAGPTQDLSGRPTDYAPRWSGSATGSYSVNLPREYSGTAALTGIFSTSYFNGNSSTDDPLLEQGGYARLDARLTLDSPNKRWAVDLIGKNLTNVYILGGGNGATGLPTSLGSLLLQREPPRTYALQLRAKF